MLCYAALSPTLSQRTALRHEFDFVFLSLIIVRYICDHVLYGRSTILGRKPASRSSALGSELKEINQRFLRAKMPNRQRVQPGKAHHKKF
jgi:hypothetical protein